jgi:hypothetical protein
MECRKVHYSITPLRHYSITASARFGYCSPSRKKAPSAEEGTVAETTLPLVA